jgi:hypothetical protein
MGSEKQPQQLQTQAAGGEQESPPWSEDDVTFMRQALAEVGRANMHPPACKPAKQGFCN